MAEIVREHGVLAHKIKESYGLETGGNFVPHITLRRFKSSDAAAMFAPHIETLREHVHMHPDEPSITYNTVSLYGFTDSTRVFKRQR